MSHAHAEFESLKNILDNIQTPEGLDSHPWVDWNFVREAVVRDPSLGDVTPGKRLILAVESLFYETMPSAPPRRGKRLDTHWGEFGLLAAQYFAPIRFGTPHPASLRDAWGRIDKSILLYVFGRDAESVEAGQTAAYQLVGGERDVAPNSTLSDWNRKGIEKLLLAVRARESYLKDHPLPVVGEEKMPDMAKPEGGKERGGRVTKGRTRKILLALTALFLLGALFTVIRARRIYDLGMRLWDQTPQLRDLAAGGASIENMRAVGPVLSQYRQDYLALKREAAPFLWIGPLLGWVPEYGGDLAAVGHLVTLSDSMLAAADTTYQALSPMLDMMEETQNSSGFDAERFVKILNEAQPQLLEAQNEVDRAITAREKIDEGRLSPRVRELVVKYVDRVLPWMQDGIVLLIEFPRVAGASSEGPKTYLLLAQNEDELRPTGGFITAAGTLLIQNGKIVDLTFDNSGGLDDWEKPYPSAPWQLKQYMGSPVLVLRDANWYADYPAMAQYAEAMYAYNHDHSVDGVISIDQHLLVELLRAMGPIEVEGAAELISAENVIEYMRAYKVPPGGASNPFALSWDSKAFINKITGSLLNRIADGDFEWESLIRVLLQALDERHVLIQIDNPALTAVAARRGWDGGIRPAQGDFLMAVDFNTGFNKTNAVVDRSMTYDVNLSDIQEPSSRLNIIDRNNAASAVPCVPAPYLDEVAFDIQYQESDYPINRCYWAYMRVYMVDGAELLDANPQTIPAEWMIQKVEVPPQVDVVDDGIAGVTGFGLLKVVPGGQEVETSLRFSLPASVVWLTDKNVWTYQLHVQKQPGTLYVPITIQVRLPDGAEIVSMPEGATFQDGVIALISNLRVDLNLTFEFTLP